MGEVSKGARLPRFLIIAFIVLLVFAGCGEGVQLENVRSSSSSGTPALTTNHFSREVRLSFLDPILARSTSQGIVILDEEEAQKYQQSQWVRPQTSAFPFVQYLTREGETEAIELIQGDPSGHQIAFAPRSLDDPVWGGVTDSILGQMRAGSSTGSATITYTLPEPEGNSTQPTLVSVGSETAPVDFVPISGNQLVVSYNWTYTQVSSDPESVSITWEILLNGEPIESREVVTGGAGSLLFLRPPLVKSTTPGLYTVHQVAQDDQGLDIERTDSYLQRKLKFRDPLPEYTPGTSDPVEIVNQILWSDGSPVLGAVWKIEEKDDVALQPAEKRGTGPDIQATWSPAASILTRTGDPPEDEEERYEAVPFSLEASADSYTIAGNGIPYEISSDFELHREVVLKIINEKVSPDFPFEDGNSEASVTADVIIFDPEIAEEDISWTVTLEDPDGFAVEDLATGTGCEISAIWNGRVDGAIVPNPTSYTFSLTATSCPHGDPPIGTARAISSQIVVEPPPEDSCPVAEKRVSMLPALSLTLSKQEIEPSYLFSVRQLVERIDAAVGAEPGTTPQEVAKTSGPSEIEFTVRLFRKIGSGSETNLTFKVTAVENSGGHQHTNNRPVGAFEEDEDEIVKPVAEVFKQISVPNVIGTEERVSFFASNVSGEYSVVLEYTEDNKLKTIQKKFKVEVEGSSDWQDLQSSLSQALDVSTDINDRNDGDVLVFGRQSEHPDYLRGTPELVFFLKRVAVSYNAELLLYKRRGIVPEELKALNQTAEELDPRMGFTDLSLPQGGLFNVEASFKPELPGHFEHRLGENADISSDFIFRVKARDKILERIVEKFPDWTIYNETKRLPNNPHYHIRRVANQGGN